MRVIFYINNIGDYHAPRLLELHNHLVSRGHTLLVIEGEEKSAFYSHTQNRAALLKQRLNTLSLSATSKRQLYTKLVSSLFKHHPDIILQLGYHEPVSSLVLMCAKIMKKRIFFLSETKGDDHSRQKIKEVLKSFLVRQFNGALVGGERHRAYFKSLGMDPASIATGYDVVDNNYFKDRSASFRRKETLIKKLGIIPSRYVLVVSRLVPRKRVELAIDIYAKSSLPGNNIDLVIIGSGPLEENVKEHIKRLGLENKIHILKNVANKHMPLFYTFAEAMILASEYDQWGLCVNESMACGTPVLLTERCGAANEIVQHGTNGYIWNGNDTQTAIDLLNKMVLEPDIQATFRRETVSTMKNWGPERFATSLYSLMYTENHRHDGTVVT